MISLQHTLQLYGCILFVQKAKDQTEYILKRNIYYNTQIKFLEMKIIMSGIKKIQQASQKNFISELEHIIRKI